MKATLTECAWAASKKKNTYLKAKYHSLVGRRGKKRALIAVGHKILIMCYHILKYKVGYKELGVDYLDVRRKDKIIKSYVKRLRNIQTDIPRQCLMVEYLLQPELRMRGNHEGLFYPIK